MLVELLFCPLTFCGAPSGSDAEVKNRFTWQTNGVGPSSLYSQRLFMDRIWVISIYCKKFEDDFHCQVRPVVLEREITGVRVIATIGLNKYRKNRKSFRNCITSYLTEIALNSHTPLKC